MTATAMASSLLFNLISQDVQLRRVAGTNGGEYAGPCIWCGGTDRLRVWPHADRPRYWCRQCEKSGDAIQYVRDKRGLTFPQAIDYLGITDHESFRAHPRGHPPIAGGSPRAPPVQVQDDSPPPAVWQKACAAFVTFAVDELWKPAGARARAYLCEKRGLTDDTIRAWGLGFNPTDLRRPAAIWGLAGDPVWLPRGVVIPCAVPDPLSRARIRTYNDYASLSMRGGLYYCKIRRPLPPSKDGSPDDLTLYLGNPMPGAKYGQPRGSRPALFGAGRLSGKETIVLAEGEFDAMLLYQLAGDLVDVVTLGSASMPLAGRWLEALGPATRVLVAYDADEAGVKRAASLATLGGRMRVTPPLDAKDLTEMWQRGINVRDWLTDNLARHRPPSLADEFEKWVDLPPPAGTIRRPTKLFACPANGWPPDADWRREPCPTCGSTMLAGLRHCSACQNAEDKAILAKVLA